VARCLTILIDGLRPDAVTTHAAPRLARLGRTGAAATGARTVRPSVTVAALTSLATGVSPRAHGLVQPGLGFLTRLGLVRPLGRELTRSGVPVVIATGQLAAASKAIAVALAAYAGVSRLVCAARGARGIADVALDLWTALPEGLLFVYINDCDLAGHAEGWMSPAYMDAVAAADAAAGRLIEAAGDALLVVLADHGGGGVVPQDHDAPHPLNDAIPLILAGSSVQCGALHGDVSLLDVPPTLLHWFGVAIPENYEGRVLLEAFAAARESVA
jgi:hypothetical protein